jgi:hypothetical protein
MMTHRTAAKAYGAAKKVTHGWKDRRPQMTSETADALK